MSPFSRWLCRASGVVFVGFFLLLDPKKVGAAGVEVTYNPSPIICESSSFTSNFLEKTFLNEPTRCFNAADERLNNVTFKLTGNQIFKRGIEYVLYIYSLNTKDANDFRYITKVADDENGIQFDWNLRGQNHNLKSINPVRGCISCEIAGFARSGRWAVRLDVVDQKNAFAIPGVSISLKDGALINRFVRSRGGPGDILINNPEFEILLSPQGNPRFYATEVCLQIDTSAKFTIKHTDPQRIYSVWWDKEINVEKMPGNGGEITLPLPGRSSPVNQKACMAVIDALHTGVNTQILGEGMLSCEDFYTFVNFQAAPPEKSCGPGVARGNAQGDPNNNYHLTKSSTLRFDPRDIVQPCVVGADEGVITGIGCIPTTASGLTTFLLRFAIGIGGGAALLIMAFGSIQMMTAQGDPEKLNEGREKFVGALAGLLFIIFSIFLLNVIGIQIFAIPGFPR